MRPLIIAIFLAAGAAAPVAAQTGKGELIVRALLEEYENNHPRKIGVMAGARHYCDYELKQFLTGYRTHIEFTMQRPLIVWERMIDQGNKTWSKLRASNVSCDKAFKDYIERLSY